MCFFFKQKTAYDMRISDWSSDVCSSDLVGGGQIDARAADVPLLRSDGRPHHDRWTGHRTGDTGVVARRGGDRKSVVEGKSVSVRVDLGGRRIIKKKNRRATD